MPKLLGPAGSRCVCARTLAHVERPLVKRHHARKADSHPMRLTAMRSSRCARNRTRLLMRPVYRCCSVELEFLQNLNMGNPSTVKVRDHKHQAVC
jgi:hypothetical protein